MKQRTVDEIGWAWDHATLPMREELAKYLDPEVETWIRGKFMEMPEDMRADIFQTMTGEVLGGPVPTPGGDPAHAEYLFSLISEHGELFGEDIKRVDGRGQ